MVVLAALADGGAKDYHITRTPPPATAFSYGGQALVSILASRAPNHPQTARGDFDHIMEAADDALEGLLAHSETLPASHARASSVSSSEPSRNSLTSDDAMPTQDDSRKVSGSRKRTWRAAPESPSKIERGVKWLKEAKELESSGGSFDSATVDRIRTYY